MTSFRQHLVGDREGTAPLFVQMDGGEVGDQTGTPVNPLGCQEYGTYNYAHSWHARIT